MAYNKKYATLGESVIDYVNDREDAIETSFNDVDTDINGVSQGLNTLGQELGALITGGTNSNGSWTKFPDGTMIAWGKTSITGLASSWVDSGNGWFYSPEVSWDYPVEFIGIPHMIANFDDERVAGRGSWTIKSEATLTYALFRAGSHRVNSANNDYPIIITIFLIGRWK